MSDKIYQSYRQQIKILRRRGMQIEKGSQGSRVIRILEKENYYNVINGYKELFLDGFDANGEEKYKAGTTFDEIYALYCFDRDLRNIYLRHLLRIENSLKTVIAHEFSEKYGFDNYLTIDNFQNSASADPSDLKYTARKYSLSYNTQLSEVQQKNAEDNISSVTKLIGDIQQEIARQMSKHHQVVTHYMTKHGYIPLWVLVNVLTFGKITNFYFNMKPNDKMNVARRLGVQPKELHKYMNMLSLARNKCAHDERFFDMKFRNNIHIKSIKNISCLGLTKNSSGEYSNGLNDVYAIAIIISQLSTKTETREFVSSIKKAIEKLEKQIHTISVDDVMKKMGYTKLWSNLLKL